MILAAVNLQKPGQRISLEIKELPVRVGRKPESLAGENTALFRVPWNDRLISRNHCLASREGDTLTVQRLPAVPGRSRPNPFYTNVPPAQRTVLDEPLRLRPGQSFTVGGRGKTAFFWLSSETELNEVLTGARGQFEIEKGTFEKRPDQKPHYDEVTQLDEYSLRLQLQLIQRDLPEQVLSGWTDESELFNRAAVFIENALPGQRGVSAAFISVESRDESVVFRLLNPDPARLADFRPSRTLLRQLNLEKPSASDVHVWTSEEGERNFSSESSLDRHIDWVAAVPVAPSGEAADLYHDAAGNPVYLYVETRQASDAVAASFLPFLRLITSLVASLLSAREKQRIQDQMSAFFSPALRAVIQEADQSALEPAMSDCTVLFADRRGTSRILERARTDEQILARLRENQRVVGVITQKVFDHKGVITDFAGDGALALWGWPKWDGRTVNHALEALEAAEAMIGSLADSVEYEEEHRRRMATVRIGISTGRIAVGKTGPAQQWHISVFGSVANLGARLERIAKEFKIPILLSDETYRRIGVQSGRRLFRKLCYIRPAGFQESYPIHELVLPRELGGSGVSRAHVQIYEQALDQFVQRRWDGCSRLLGELPPDDEPARWLKEKNEIFRNRPLSDQWEGEIASFSK